MCPDEDNVEIATHTFKRDYPTDYDMYDPELGERWDDILEDLSRPAVLSLAAATSSSRGTTSPTKPEMGEGYRIIVTYEHIAGAPRNGRSSAPRMGIFRSTLPQRSA